MGYQKLCGWEGGLNWLEGWKPQDQSAKVGPGDPWTKAKLGFGNPEDTPVGARTTEPPKRWRSLVEP